MDTRQVNVIHTDTAARPRRRGILRFVAAALVAFVVVEGVARAVETGVSDAQLYAVSTEAHARQLRDGRTPDVLMVGSSSSGAAISAPRLVEAGVACDPYSLWLAGPTMEDIARHTTHILDDLPIPGQVMIGVTMREFNATATNLDNVEVDTFLDGDQVDGVMEVLADRLAMIRMRSVFQDPRRLGRLVLGAEDLQVGPDGHRLSGVDRVIAQESDQHRQQEIDELGEFRLRDADLLALEELIGYLTDRGANVTVVNLPVTDQFIQFAPNGTQDYVQYLDAVEAVARRTGTPFFDGQAVPFDVATQFADVNHLNDDGARSFTDAVTASSVLPPVTSCP